MAPAEATPPSFLPSSRQKSEKAYGDVDTKAPGARGRNRNRIPCNNSNSSLAVKWRGGGGIQGSINSLVACAIRFGFLPPLVGTADGTSTGACSRCSATFHCCSHRQSLLDDCASQARGREVEGGERRERAFTRARTRGRQPPPAVVDTRASLDTT